MAAAGAIVVNENRSLNLIGDFHHERRGVMLERARLVQQLAQLFNPRIFQDRRSVGPPTYDRQAQRGSISGDLADDQFLVSLIERVA